MLLKANVFIAAIALTLAVAHAASRDGALIRNTGSTNATGYTVKIWSDGSVSKAASDAHGRITGAWAKASVPLSVARKFFAALKLARDVRAKGEPCMKSASFGSTTLVFWHGWTSPDLECPGEGALNTLSADVHDLVARLRAVSAHRIPMLPHEPRRQEASPSPESGPPAA